MSQLPVNPLGDGSSFEPTKVAIVDLSDSMPTLTSKRSPHGRYRGAWILVLDHGQPFRIVELPFEEDEIGGDDLREILVGDDAIETPSPRLPELDDDDLPFVSIVVPTTFGRFEQLQKCAARLSSLDYPHYEVVIVDNRPNRVGSAAERASISELPHINVTTEPVPGISAARNRGIREASADIIAFTDDDARPHPQWLRALATRFVVEPTASCVTGLVVPGELETVTQEWFEQSGYGPEHNLHRYSYRSLEGDRSSNRSDRGRFRAQRTEGTATIEHSIYEVGSFGMGNNFACRRAFLENIGGFELALGVGTPTKGGEDALAFMELMYVSGTLAYEPSAIVGHINRSTYEELHEQILSYGVGYTAALTALVMKNPRHLVGYSMIFRDAVRSLRNFSPPKTEGSRPADFPKELPRLQLYGMMIGPFTYAWSSAKYRSAKRSARV